MHITRLSSKGQVIIPKAVRDGHGWVEGMEFVVQDDGMGGVVLRLVNPFAATTVAEVFGWLKYHGPAKSLDDMAAGIEDALQERWDRKGT